MVKLVKKSVMSNKKQQIPKKGISAFQRGAYNSLTHFSYMGKGELGGKAHGLVKIRDTLDSFISDHPVNEIEFGIPPLTVITTSFFDQFMEMNHLYDTVDSDMGDESLAHHFQKAELPPLLNGDLRSLINQTNTPLAIRSSSLLEDSLESPFAGVYKTKMIPNNQSDPSLRFRKLIEAIKFIYASTFFKNARNYMKSTGNSLKAEKMGVIIQKVAGQKYSSRFYPNLSGVGRSFNFYPIGDATPEDGIVSLALGLGKTIVDGGIAWSYSPEYPRISPPFNSINDLLKQTQKEFWAVNMGPLPAYDPVKETEYLIHLDLEDAEYDNTLKYICSTYDPASDRINIGTTSKGPRIINFSPILELDQIPLNSVIQQILRLCETQFRAKVEIEFAMTFPGLNQKVSVFSLLQIRPINITMEMVSIHPDEAENENCILSSVNVLGNGIQNNIQDIVYIKPEAFNLKHSRVMADQLDKMNRWFMENNRSYLLIICGRLGSSDPWLGIPVEWGQISGARAIVEVKLENIHVDLSQGSHFFHNISNLKIFYFSLNQSETSKFDWQWLEKQETIQETDYLKHIRLSRPLKMKVDGRKKQGVILK
jgi:hypothetical protein